MINLSSLLFFIVRCQQWFKARRNQQNRAGTALASANFTLASTQVPAQPTAPPGPPSWVQPACSSPQPTQSPNPPPYNVACTM